MAGLITLAVVAGFVGIIAGTAYLGYKILCWSDDRRDAKRRREHPELYFWFDECNEAGATACRWYNNEIAPRKKKVDAILAQIDYLPAEQRAKKEAELEELRNQIWLAEITNRTLDAQTEEIREKIHNYVEKHNLEWARSWGW